MSDNDSKGIPPALVHDEKVQQALNYLAGTDEEHAAAKAEMVAMKELTKTVLAYEFLDAEGAIEKRKAASYQSKSYQGHIEKIQSLEIKYQTMLNKRDRAKLTIELWRSCNANRRQGNI